MREPRFEQELVAGRIKDAQGVRRKVHRKVALVQFARFAVRLVVHVLLLDPKRRRIARRGQMLQLLQGGVREVNTADDSSSN